MSRRWPLLPTVIVAAAVAAMIALGVWQLRRAEWKGELIARYERAGAMSSNVPWPRSESDMERALFRWSQFTCERVLAINSRAGTSIGGQKGWSHIARCTIDGGGEAEAALGWSSEPRRPQWSGGEVAGTIGPGGVLYASMPPAGLTPLASPDPADLPNNHLAYAGQWFFFALTAAVIYVLALRRRRRDG
jgi:surfeit locus 1 family protein